jgi:hypothetical protein
MMISMDMADKDALEVSQGFPGIRIFHTKISDKLAPSTFAGIKKDITPIRYLHERT